LKVSENTEKVTFSDEASRCQSIRQTAKKNETPPHFSDYRLLVLAEPPCSPLLHPLAAARTQLAAPPPPKTLAQINAGGVHKSSDWSTRS